MVKFSKPYENLVDLLEALPDEEACIKHLERIHWPDGVIVDPAARSTGLQETTGTRVLIVRSNFQYGREQFLKKAGCRCGSGLLRSGL